MANVGAGGKKGIEDDGDELEGIDNREDVDDIAVDEGAKAEPRDNGCQRHQSEVKTDFEESLHEAGLVLEVDLLGFDDGEANEFGVVEIGFSKVDGGNLVVVIGGVVKSTLIQIVTVAINRVFVFVIAEVAATVLLVDGMKDVEELTDAGKFVVF